ncbi:uncharacterized protein EV154DRAFT_487277 [Mucor mucedo]|uniref:uncharacterized protein n=1 Tax=Mucor mucedo TaxID=29922 RepID=UPI00221EDBC6|nr:uncharacterized protein EV154DRAFT_487277 [Mucor mucedo]KAI7873352.1 hypothetical protein EV154DRAFT_487277 [Mucor mucedo]
MPVQRQDIMSSLHSCNESVTESIICAFPKIINFVPKTSPKIYWKPSTRNNCLFLPTRVLIDPCLVRQVHLELIWAHLDEQFGVEAVYVMGNWSAPNTRFHEPIGGLEQVSAIQPVNVEVLKSFGWLITRALIDEEQILVAINSNTNRIVLLLCNRDMVACLNMVDIVRSLRAGTDILPQDFDVDGLPRTNGEEQGLKIIKQTLEIFVKVVTRIFQACYRRSTIDTLK